MKKMFGMAYQPLFTIIIFLMNMHLELDLKTRLHSSMSTKPNIHYIYISKVNCAPYNLRLHSLTKPHHESHK